MNHRSILEQLTLGNYAATQLWEGWLAQLRGSWVCQSSTRFTAITLPFPEFVSFHPVQSDNNSQKLWLPVSLACAPALIITTMTVGSVSTSLWLIPCIHGFPRSLQENAGIVPKIRPCKLPYKSFPGHHSLSSNHLSCWWHHQMNYN
jgi:hypothetical protein